MAIVFYEAGEVLYKREEGDCCQYSLVRVRQKTRNRVNRFRSYRIVECLEDAASLQRTMVSITDTMMALTGYVILLDKKLEDKLELPSLLRLQRELDNRDSEQCAYIYESGYDSGNK